MATHFEQQPHVEGPVGAEPASPVTPEGRGVGQPRSARGRIARLVVGSLTVGLIATTLVLRLTRGRQRRSGRRRGALVDVQPRIAVFAPTITISLPFSGITGRSRAGRTGRFAGRRRARERRGRWAVGRPA
jgi:hypothetical protein